MKNYIPKDKGNTVWTDHGVCEKQSGKKCFGFDSDKDDVEVMLPKMVEVTDFDKPIYAARTDETDCQLYDRPEGDMEWVQPADDCRSITTHTCTGIFPDMVCEPALCTDKSYYSLYASKADFGLGEGYFAYCTKLSYGTKLEEQFVVDEPLRVAKAQRIAAETLAAETKLAEDNTRAQELKAHINELQTKLDAWATATDNQKMNMIKDTMQILKKTIKQLLKDEK